MFIQKKGGSSKSNYSFSTRDKKRFIGDVKFKRVKVESNEVEETDTQKKDKKGKKTNNKELKDKEE